MYEEIVKYLPFPVHENRVLDLSYSFHNNKVEVLLKKDYDEWCKEGHSFVLKIANPKVHSYVLEAIKLYQKTEDSNSVLTYFQHLKICNHNQWILSYKIFSNKDTYLNIAQPLNEFGQIGKLLNDVLGESFIKRNGWEMYRSLSKREKEVMKCLAEGSTSKQISQNLYISKLTVDTHRRNIFNKLQIKNYAELFKLAQGFELIQLR